MSGRCTRYTLTGFAEAGAAAAGAAPPPEPVDYRYAEAVALARALGAAGWQERDDGIVFWLPAASPPDTGLVARLRRLGRLEIAAEHDDWLVRWREFHRPVVVGPLYVRAPWQPPREGTLDLAIEVGMAFGTGGHATTRQCLEALVAAAPGVATPPAVSSPAAVVDLGTGSGVLALAAARLGFAPVTGLDVDPVAIEAAAANAHANGLAVELAAADVRDPGVSLPRADVAVANLALAPILALGRRVAPRAAEGWRPRRLLLAGLLAAQGAEAVGAFPGYAVRRRALDRDWLFLELEDEGAGRAV